MTTSFPCLSLLIVSLCSSLALMACIRWCSRRGQPVRTATILCTWQWQAIRRARFRSQRVECRLVERFEFFTEYEATNLMMCPISMRIDEVASLESHANVVRSALSRRPLPPWVDSNSVIASRLIERRCCEPNLPQIVGIGGAFQLDPRIDFSTRSFHCCGSGCDE